MKKIFGLLICIIVIVLINCSTKKDKTAGSTGLQTVSYQDSVFLGFEGDLSDPALIWNMNIYLPAHDRIIRHVYLKNGRLAWDIKNGAELKISENIFKYVTNALTYENEVLLPSGEYEIRQEVSNGFYVVIKKSPNTPDSLWKKIK